MPTNPSLLIVPYRYKAAKLYSQLPESGAGDFTVTRSTTATRTNASGLLESVASGVPRLDYQGGGCPALLVEPAATNLLLRSEGFDDAAWVKTRTTISANSTTAPNGAATADKIIANTDNNSHFVDQPITTPSGTAFTISFYAKASEYNFIQINNQVDNSIANFDLLNGVLGTISGYTASITNVGNGWYRCVATRTFSTAPTTHRLALITSASSARLESFVGDGTSGVFVWGAQAENGSVATSYIPTVAATQTRNADVISVSSVSGLIGQTQGTLYAEVNLSNPDKSVIRTILGIGDGTATNRFSIRRDTNGRIIVICVVGGSTIGFVQTGIDQLGVFKIAAAYAINDLTLYANGVLVGSTTIASIPACSRIDLGKVEGTGTSNFLNDRIRAAAIYTSRLSNAELETLTTL